ncbi:unnamed protein product [Echinostoma caproni]|uniref:RING-type E3 ubiquitin transferase n=1 Tax=Echinostoma caproni TaxID=27848 RepID=A0A183AZ81_9TREM|nr:unnamed protein product [Echinostoma caproni]
MKIKSFFTNVFNLPPFFSAGMDNAPSKNWELTLYELHRKPQEPITDGTEIAVSPRSLKSELMCPICLDILKVTMTTKECLHRFCSECIVTALRSGNKECPTCRKKLVSKRSLRRDPNFDALIAKIYPSREVITNFEERILMFIYFKSFCLSYLCCSVYFINDSKNDVLYPASSLVCSAKETVSASDDWVGNNLFLYSSACK